MSQRFVFYRTDRGSQLHNGDDAMTESQAEVVLNDLWDSHKDALEKIEALEKESAELKNKQLMLYGLTLV
tara:strand:+ start:555 stop:764 length:210 start_codon:yes stop_codon:yes gene_type:complete